MIKSNLHPTINITNNSIASKLIFIQLGSRVFKYVLLYVVQSLPYAIINYLPRKGLTKDHTKGSMLAVKLQVVDRLWPVKLYIYSRQYRSCIVSAGLFAFSRENSLWVGDVCIFELTMTNNIVFKVHIFRFVD